MSNAVSSARDHYAGQTYQDIALADGDDLPPVLRAYSVAKDMDPFLAHVLDQDTNIMRWQREGMYASEKGAETLSIYQESRIRHVHQTLDKYLND